MNIFYTNEVPLVCALDHCTIHGNKMIIESAQLLSSAHHILDDQRKLYIPKLTHENHPCAIWVRESKEHYFWLLELFAELIRNYNNHHTTEHVMTFLINILAVEPDNIESHGFVAPPLCMPEQFKKDDHVQAYRGYMRHKFKDWSERKTKRKITPKWYDGVRPSWL